ncbi:recombinase family protein [Ruminococcus bromii]|uniref:recombinase family protein n=1 Tax=Ruminococcus bromii TaxID=40518 RepID=UPI00292ED2BF|nr:recombinase family protein [Ruminococcus bromii]MDE8725540.1 recombinase family protein [Ruminococcus bromii]
MKKHRSLPFGYTITDGRLIIEPSEAEAIRKIFADYAGGASLSELAATLTKLQIPYSEKRTDWNKNMVARIIGNRKYTGADGFDPIIDLDIFKEANLSKDQKIKKQHCHDNTTIGIFRARLICKACGSRMIRLYEKRNREQVRWICENPACRIRICISDELLECRVVDRMNLIIDNPDLLECPDCYLIEDSGSIQRSRTAQELGRMCDSGNYSDEQLLDVILSGAQKRYDQCPQVQGNAITGVSIAFSEAEKSEELDTELFLKTANHILLDADGSIQLRLKNGKDI